MTVHAAAITLGAALLFCVQPLVARLVLPRFGGSAAVWTTCMLFFQTLLLAGYALSHAGPVRLGARRHAILHAVLLAASLLLLPLSLPAAGASPADRPIASLLALLLPAVGLPFVLLAATSPLVQLWDSRSGKDPYFLYAAGNAGSLAGLLAYPLLLEPTLTLGGQSRLWSAGYVLFAVLMGIAAVRAARRPPEAPSPAPSRPQSPPGWRTRLSWVALAFFPSSLLLGVTSHLTSDIAPVPLLWVVPLALYLLTFISAFSSRPLLPQPWVLRIQPVAVVVLLVCSAWPDAPLLPVLFPLNLLAFGITSLACHAELSRRRPAPERLTEFYLWLAAGGALGGGFNSLIAPWLLVVPVEYFLVLAIASAALPRLGDGAGSRRSGRLDVLIPLGVAGGTVAFGALLDIVDPGAPPGLVVLAPAGLIALFESDRRIRFGLAALFLAGGSIFFTQIQGQEVLHRDRSFFAALRVIRRGDEERHLVHGRILHGAQSLLPARRHEPLTYYYRRGPIGDVFRLFERRLEGRAVGVVGLGAGTMAAYARPGQSWTFFEIDPAVVRIARDPRLFTYLSQAATTITIVLDDGRRGIQARDRERYALLALDAFTSDAIPYHLLTREAVAVYRSRLAPDGLLAFHISGRYVDLRRPLANLAADAGLAACIRVEGALTREAQDRLYRDSTWVVFANRPEDAARLLEAPGWERLEGRPGERLWTDEYVNLAGALKFN